MLGIHKLAECINAFFSNLKITGSRTLDAVTVVTSDAMLHTLHNPGSIFCTLHNGRQQQPARNLNREQQIALHFSRQQQAPPWEGM